ncbi:MAG: metallophosphoesterase [Verrucomicrobiota bacterium]
MHWRQWVLFLFFVVTLLTLLHGFIGAHVWPLLPAGTTRLVFALVFTFLAFSYLAARLLESWFPGLGRMLAHIGSWWLGFMAYLFLGCLLFDVFLLIDQVVPVFEHLPVSLLTALRLYFLILCLVIAITLVLGHLNVCFPRVRQLTLASSLSLRIAVMSDLHLSGLVSPQRLERVVDLINRQHPDLILLPGDIVDDDLSVTAQGETFRNLMRQLKAPLGVFAVTGNHEWISGVQQSVDWLESCQVRVLRDEAIDVGPLVLAGREDFASSRMGAEASTSLAEILKDVGRSKPLILLDHQPSRIPEAVQNKVNLLLCGHTHHGQFWPFQMLTKRLFPLSYGHRRFDSTDVYVSCGAGAWGPQVRTSSRGEIVLLELIES